MQFLTTGILFSIVVVADIIQAELSPDGENVCLQTETYMATIEVEVMKLVTEKTKKSCWKFWKFFECENKVTKMKPVKEPQVLQRTRIVPKCCDGYAEEKRVNKCSPVCLNGCKNGKCVAPGVCACSSGFYGSKCEKVCPKNFWGNSCVNKCGCSNNGNCDNVSGRCNCDSGWRGKSCELPCQEGYYGYLCEKKCNCNSHFCDHKTGECIITTTETLITVTLSSTTESTTETSIETHQPTESSTTTTILDEELSTIEEEILLEDTKPTTEEIVSSEITSDALDVTITLRNEGSAIKMIEESNKSEKETKTFNLEQISFSRDTENITDISNKTKEISVSETFSIFNCKENILVRTNSNEDEKNFDRNGTNNLTNERKQSSSNQSTLKVFNFIPTLSVISGVSFLIFIIAAQWIISRLRKKAVITGKKGKRFQPKEQIKFQAGNFFWVNNCPKDPLSIIELSTAPTLKTFKPSE